LISQQFGVSFPPPAVAITGSTHGHVVVADIMSESVTSADVALRGGADTLVDVGVGIAPVNGSILAGNQATDSNPCWGKSGPNNRVHVGDNFILRSFTRTPFSSCFSSLPSPLISNNTTCSLYDYSLSFSNHFPSHFHFSSLSSPFSTLNHSLSSVSSLSTIIFPLKCFRATPFCLPSAHGRCHGVTLPVNASVCGASSCTTLPLSSLFRTLPGIPYKWLAPDIIPLACSHIVAVLNTASDSDWSLYNDAIVASGRVAGKAMISGWPGNIEDVVSESAFQVSEGWGHEDQAGSRVIKSSIPSFASILHHNRQACF
jgi:hypothetical protein